MTCPDPHTSEWWPQTQEASLLHWGVSLPREARVSIILVDDGGIEHLWELTCCLPHLSCFVYFFREMAS